MEQIKQISHISLLCIVDMLASAKNSENRTASLLSDMDHLEIAVSKLQEMLERVSQYVDKVVVRRMNYNFHGDIASKTILMVGWRGKAKQCYWTLYYGYCIGCTKD